MKCSKCGDEFLEKDLHESHDVPCYLFEGNRKGRKNQADKFGRHWLCLDCHKEYESYLQSLLRAVAKQCSQKYFKKKDDTPTT